MVKWYDYCRILKMCRNTCKIGVLLDKIETSYTMENDKFNSYKKLYSNLYDSNLKYGISVEIDDSEINIFIDEILVFECDTSFNEWQFIHSKPKSVELEVISIIKEYNKLYKNLKRRMKQVKSDHDYETDTLNSRYRVNHE